MSGMTRAHNGHATCLGIITLAIVSTVGNKIYPWQNDTPLILERKQRFKHFNLSDDVRSLIIALKDLLIKIKI